MKLIDKDKIVEELKKRLKANGAFDEVGDEAWAYDQGMCDAYKSILSFLDTLEVKEVDLKKEIEKVKKMFNCLELREETIIYFCAKRFFELGLKAKGK